MFIIIFKIDVEKSSNWHEKNSKIGMINVFLSETDYCQSMENRWKIDGKSMRNQYKIHKQSIKAQSIIIC